MVNWSAKRVALSKNSWPILLRSKEQKLSIHPDLVRDADDFGLKENEKDEKCGYLRHFIRNQRIMQPIFESQRLILREMYLKEKFKIG